MQELRVAQRSPESSSGAWSGRGPAAVPLDGGANPAGQLGRPGLNISYSGPEPSHIPSVDPAGQLRLPVRNSYSSSPAPADPWHAPVQGPPVQALAPQPTAGQLVPWAPALTHAFSNQLGQAAGRDDDEDDDEDDYPSDPDAPKTCYRLADHNQRPPPASIKVRMTSANYRSTRSLRVCEKCWRWMSKPNSGVQVILRGSSRLTLV